MPSHTQRRSRRESPSDSEAGQYSYDDSGDDHKSKRSSKRVPSHASSRRRPSHHHRHSPSSSDGSAASDPNRGGSSSQDTYSKTNSSHRSHSRSRRSSIRREGQQPSASELEKLSIEELKQEEQNRAKWIQSRNLLKEARTAAIRNQRQPRQDPLISRPVLGATEEVAATSRATAMITHQLQALIQDIAAFRAGKHSPLDVLRSELHGTGRAREVDQYVAEQLAEMGVASDALRDEDQTASHSRKAFAYYKIRLTALLAGQSAALCDQYNEHLKKAYRVAELREKLLQLERMIRDPPINGKEAQIRRGIDFNAALAIETCGILLQAVRRVEVTASEYTELNVRITNILQQAGAVKISRAEGKLDEGRFPWIRKPAFIYYDPKQSIALVDGRLGPMFLPTYKLASKRTYDVQLRGRFLECVRIK